MNLTDDDPVVRDPKIPSWSAALIFALAVSVTAFSQTQLPKTPAVNVTIRPSGFSPAAATQHAGNILFLIHNRSGEQHIAMHLKKQDGARIHDMPVAEGQAEWQELVKLDPGKYILTEDGHGTWECRITIE
jgi:hypothetical protein